MQRHKPGYIWFDLSGVELPSLSPNEIVPPTAEQSGNFDHHGDEGIGQGMITWEPHGRREANAALRFVI